MILVIAFCSITNVLPSLADDISAFPGEETSMEEITAENTIKQTSVDSLTEASSTQEQANHDINNQSTVATNSQEASMGSDSSITQSINAETTDTSPQVTSAADGTKLTIPEQNILFDELGRIQVDSIESVNTSGEPDGVTYCSRIARSNIESIIKAGGQTTLPAIARGDAEVLIAQGVANQTIFSLESQDIANTLQSLFSNNKNTVFDLYISYIIGTHRIGHRVTIFLASNNQFYVLDPICGNKTTKPQLLSDYLHYFNDSAQFYVSTIGFNPILTQKQVWLGEDSIQDENIMVSVPSQNAEVKDLGGDSTFQDINDFRVNKVSEQIFEVGDPSSHLEFTKPIKIEIAVDLPDDTPVPLQVKHEGDADFGTRGLTTNPDASCSEGISSDETALALVQGGMLTFYSCAASTFMVDLGFALGGGDGFDGPIFTSIIQPDGKVLVAGDFTNYTGNSQNRLIRFTTGGSIDTTFAIGEGFNDIVNTIVYESGGKIIVGGYFTTYDGNSVNRIVRLNSDGSIDTGFIIGGGFNGSVHSLAIETGGKIIVGGLFTVYSGVNQNRITRLTTTGARDTSFIIGGGFDSTVLALAIETGGNIIVGGSFNTFSGVGQNRITRLTTTGARDTSFIIGTGFNGSGVNALALESGGKILVGGSFTSYSGVNQNRITRLTTTGARDTSFIIGTGFNNTVKTITLQSDGNIIVGGYFSSYSGSIEKYFVRLTSTGKRDTSYAVPGGTVNGGVQVVALQSDGKIIAGGFFSIVNGTGRNRILRIESGGVIDTSFNVGSGFNSGVLAIAIQTDGKVIVGGGFTNYQGSGKNRIVRLNTDGSIDTSFFIGSGFNGDVNAIGLQSDGKIVVGGTFTTYSGTARNRIIRLTTTGAIDSTFSIGGGFNSTVNAILVQPDDKILVGGQFTTYNAVNQRRIARLTTTGAMENFAAGAGASKGANSTVFAIGLQASGEVLIGGAFTTYGGVARTRIARLSSTGALDTNYIVGGGFNSTVNGITIDSNNKAVIVGAFTGYSGSSFNRIARLTSTGRADTSFIIGGGFDATVNSVLIQPDQKILVGGFFTSFSGEIQNGIARLSTIAAPTFINPGSGQVNGGSTLFVVGTGEPNATITVQISGKVMSDSISSSGYRSLTFTGLATGTYIASGFVTTDNNTSDTGIVYFIMSGGTVCIYSPNFISFTGTTASNTGQSLEIQSDYFIVEDQKGGSSGYYTTLSISNLSGSTGNWIANTGIQRKADPIVLVSGSNNSLVYVDTGITSYTSASSTTTFIRRDSDPVGGIMGSYGSMLWVKIDLPAYVPVDAYTGVITYTLIEN